MAGPLIKNKNKNKKPFFNADITAPVKEAVAAQKNKPLTAEQKKNAPKITAPAAAPTITRDLTQPIRTRAAADKAAQSANKEKITEAGRAYKRARDKEKENIAAAGISFYERQKQERQAHKNTLAAARKRREPIDTRKQKWKQDAEKQAWAERQDEIRREYGSEKNRLKRSNDAAAAVNRRFLQTDAAPGVLDSRDVSARQKEEKENRGDYAKKMTAYAEQAAKDKAKRIRDAAILTTYGGQESENPYMLGQRKAYSNILDYGSESDTQKTAREAYKRAQADYDYQERTFLAQHPNFEAQIANGTAAKEDLAEYRRIVQGKKAAAADAFATENEIRAQKTKEARDALTYRTLNLPNADEAAKAEEKQLIDRSGFIGGNAVRGDSNIPNLEYMNEEEKKAALILYHESPAKAKEYGRMFNAEKTEAINKNLYELTEKHPIAGGIAGGLISEAMFIPKAAAGAMYTAQNAGRAVMGKDAKAPQDTSYMWVLSGDEAIKRGMKVHMNELASFMLDCGFSVADSFQAALVNRFVPNLGTAMMASASAGQSGASAYMRGGTAAQVALSAAAGGAAEYLTETVQISNLSNLLYAEGRLRGIARLKNLLKTGLESSNRVKGLKIIAAGVASQFGEEAREEIISSLATSVFDCIIMGDNSEYKQTIAQYMEKGMDSESARAAAIVEHFMKQPAMSGLAGGVSGAVSGGIAAGVQVGRVLTGSFGGGKVTTDGSHKAHFATTLISIDKVKRLMEQNPEMFRGVTAKEVQERHNARAAAFYAASKAFNVNIAVADTQNGYATGAFDRTTNTVYLSPNATAADIARIAEAHELVHTVENTKAYKKLARLVIGKAYGGTNTEAFQSALNEIITRYADAGEALSVQDGAKELVAEQIRKIYLNNPQALYAFVNENYRGLGKEFFMKLSDLAGKVLNIGGADSSASGDILRQFGYAMNERRRGQALNELADAYGILDRNKGNNTSFAFLGKDEDGVEVYETSGEVRNVSLKERKNKEVPPSVEAFQQDSSLIGGRLSTSYVDNSVPQKSGVVDTQYMQNGKKYSKTSENSQKMIPEDGSRYDFSKPFSEQIEDWKDGKLHPYDSLIVSGTPELYQTIGFNALPVTINQTHVDYAINGTKDIDHTFGETVLAQLPEAIKTPIAVIRSETVPNRAVILLDMNVNGKNTVVPVQIDGGARQNNLRIDSNALVSIYNKTNGAAKLLYKAIQSENSGKVSVFFVDNKKANALLGRAGLQLPGGPFQNNGFVHSIREKNANVKLKIENVTQSKQFKRWFGDWENDPKHASKVVNEDGTPKVVYHGSKSNFTVFDSSKGGQSNEIAKLGFWFTESEKGAKSFTDNVWYGEEKDGKIYSVYLDIKKPKIYETTDNSLALDGIKQKISPIDSELSLLDSTYYFEDGRRFHSQKPYDRANRRNASVAEWDAFKSIVLNYDTETQQYYLSRVKESARETVSADARHYLELVKQRKEIERQISELRYSDAYEKFKSDIYKTAGQSSEDANIAGIGRLLSNASKTIAKYVETLKKQGYDGIIIQNTSYDSGDFGDNNTQYVVFEPTQIKSATDNIGTFDRHNPDIRYMIPEKVNEQKIQPNISEDERAKILSEKDIYIVSEPGTGHFDSLKGGAMKAKLSALRKNIKEIMVERGFFKKYPNADLQIEAEYTGRGVNESIYKSKFENRGDWIELLNRFEYVFRTAKVVDATRKYAGTAKENYELKAAYTLLGAFHNKKGEVVPCQFTVKAYKKSAKESAKLYMGIALTKISDERIVAPPPEINPTANAPLSSDTLSLTQFVQLVNPSDDNFLKHIPDSLLTEAQQETAHAARERDRIQIEGLKKSGVQNFIPPTEEKTKFEKAEKFFNGEPIDLPPVEPTDTRYREPAKYSADKVEEFFAPIESEDYKRAEAAEQQRAALENKRLHEPKRAEDDYLFFTPYHAEKLTKAEKAWDEKISKIDTEKMQDKKYAKETAATVLDAISDYHAAERVRDGIIADYADVYGDKEKKVVEALLTGLITENEIPKSVDDALVKEVYAASQAAYRMQEELGSIFRAAKQGYFNQAEALLKDSDNFRILSGAALHGLTPDRVLEKTANGNENTKNAFLNELIYPMQKNSAKAAKYLKDLRKRVKNLDISTKRVGRNALSEDEAIQYIGEAAGNIRYYQKRIDYNNAHGLPSPEKKMLTQVLDGFDAFRKNNPDFDLDSLRKKAGAMQEIYDELYQKVNEQRILAGQMPFAYRDGYFYHYTNTTPDSWHAWFGLGSMTDEQQLPTDIFGNSEYFTPGIAYAAFANKRNGDKAKELSVLRGFDQYSYMAADIIYHTEDIQKFRALEKVLDEKHSNESVKKRIQALLKAQRDGEGNYLDQIAELKRRELDKFGNLAMFFHEMGNTLANKKSHLDRGAERLFSAGAGKGKGRIYNGFRWVERQTRRNLIAYNVSAALSNTEALAACFSDVSLSDFNKAAFDMAKSLLSRDGFSDSSAFLQARGNVENLRRTVPEKIGDAGFVLANLTDSFVSEWVTRAYYRKGLRKGMSAENAMQFADLKAAKCIGDRSKGMTPLIFKSKHPIATLLTTFQLEVSNRFQFIGDAVKEKTAEGGLNLLFFLLKYMLGTYLFDDLYEKITGRRIALDPIGIANAAAGRATGKKVDNVCDILYNAAQGKGFTVLENAQKAQLGSFMQETGKDILEQLPFIGGLIGGGRVPVSAALPDFNGIKQTLDSKTKSKGQKAFEVSKDLLLNPASALLLPGGGSQIKKTAAGVKALGAGGVYTDNGKEERLRYPVSGNFGNAAKGVLFGKSAFDENRQWVDSGFQTLSGRATKSYRELVKAKVPTQKAWELTKAVAYAKPKTDKNGFVQTTKKGVQREILLKADIPLAEKSKMDKNMVQTGKNRKDIDYGKPNYVRAIERYRSYDREKDGADNLTHYSKGFDEKQKRLLSLAPDSEKGAEARRMALLADKNLSVEEKQELDKNFFGGDYSNPEPSKTTYAAFKERAKGTLTYDKYVVAYNEAAGEKTKSAAIRKFMDRGLSFESAAQLYDDLGIKHVRNYENKSKYYASALSDSQFVRLQYVTSHMGIKNTATYYALNKIMRAGGATKKKQVQALIDFGLPADEAYHFYALCHKKMW